MRGAGSAARRGAGGAQPGAGGARRAGRRQDGAAGVRGRAGVGLPGGARRGRRSRRWSSRSPGCISCARRCWIALERLPGAAARCAAARRSACSRGAGAGSLPGRPGRAEPAVRGGRGAAAGLPGRRRAVARSRLGAGARVRRAPPGGGVGRLGLRGPRAPSDELAGLPELVVEGLREGDARALLDSVLAGPLDERVRDRIVAETRGNPLALLELPRGLTPAELAGGFGLPGAAPLVGPDRGELPAAARRASRRRRGGCCCSRRPSPSATRRWCGGRPSGSGSAPRPRRRRPRPACSSSARGCGFAIRWCARRSTGRRRCRSGRSVHRALAEVTDPEVDPDRRAWHRAQAAAGPDEEVAAELERSAGRAQARGGLAAAAAFLERAAMLTPGSGAPGAARAGGGAGQARRPARSTRHCGLLVDGRGRPARRARSAPGSSCCAARSRSPSSRGSDAAAAAARARPGASSRSTPTWRARRYLEALGAAMFAGRPGQPAAACWRRPRPRAPRPPAPEPPRAVDLLLDGVGAAVRRRDTPPAAPMLKRALELRSRGDDVADEEDAALARGWPATSPPSSCGTTSAGTRSPLASVQLARDAGALTVLLRRAQHSRRDAPARRRARPRPRSLIEEARRITEATGNRIAPVQRRCALAAWRGQRGRGRRS